MRRKKRKTSVLIVENSGRENRLIQVPTKILLNWKKYLILSSTIIIFLLSVIGVFIYQKTSSFYQEKLARANKIRSLIDMNKVRQSFDSIDESILKINMFLENRGIKDFNLQNAGGVIEDFKLTDINEMAEYYDSKVKDLEKTLVMTPLGYPVYGDITSAFGYRNNPFGGFKTEFHAGLDFRGKVGEPIQVTAKGKVVFAGFKGGYGRCVIVKHSKLFTTLYGHLSKISVKVNEEVEPGQTIGLLGNSGRSTGPHLHYEVHQNNKKTNPELFLNF